MKQTTLNGIAIVISGIAICVQTIVLTLNGAHILVLFASCIGGAAISAYGGFVLGREHSAKPANPPQDQLESRLGETKPGKP
jgi:hypothetical protein